MQDYSKQNFTYTAEQSNSASCAMFANAFTEKFRTAIIPLMAVIFLLSVCNNLALGVIPVIILGIILIVRGEIKPESRTR